jgi:hypothetical protein
MQVYDIDLTRTHSTDFLAENALIWQNYEPTQVVLSKKDTPITLVVIVRVPLGMYGS